MIRPLLKDDALLTDIGEAGRKRDTLNIWWLGQSGYLVQWNGEHLLFDPYLSDSLTKKYADTPKPHVRMTELVIDPARIDFIDSTVHYVQMLQNPVHGLCHRVR